jgi:ABC-2 type transport system ATP-binding protein
MIELTKVSKRYGKKAAVSDLSFTVRPGIVTGFLGPNGSGKSTTMRLILGLDSPDSGAVTVNGKHYRDHRAPLHQVGALLEAGSLHGGRSAYNHLLALAQTHGLGRGRVEAMIELVGLGEVAHKRAGTFSLGMRQRLGIAAALLADPRVVMLDEPVNGLDPEGILWVRKLMRRLAGEGRTVFVSSHLMSEMALTADHLVVIGRALGTDLVEIRGVDAKEIGLAAHVSGIVLYELAPRRASLEDAFMELTGEAVEYRAGADEAVAVGAGVA